MNRNLVVACLTLCVLANTVLAQAPPQMPKPGVEHKRLHYFVGKWNYEFNMKESSSGPAGKMTGTDRNEMMPGGFFIVMHSDGKGTIGELKGLAIMGYNADDKVYTYSAFNNWGEVENSKGTVEGDTWTWTSESKMGGKLAKTKFTLKELSATSYTMRFEVQGEDGSWKEIMDGKATKVEKK